MSLKHSTSTKAGERKGGSNSSRLLGVLLPPPVPLPQNQSFGYPPVLQVPFTAPRPHSTAGFGAEQAHLSREAGTALQGAGEALPGGSGGAQQLQDSHRQVWGGGSVL